MNAGKCIKYGKWPLDLAQYGKGIPSGQENKTGILLLYIFL